MGRAGIIDGSGIAAAILGEAAGRAALFARREGRPPGLAMVLVGDDPASSVYVRMKIRECARCGIRSFFHKLPEEISTEEVLFLLSDIGRDEEVDGLLVQLPLPRQIDTKKVLDAIDPARDVDGFNPVNVGRLVRGDAQILAPCTPVGVIRLLDVSGIDPRGMNAVVVGRSDIVGKPMALMLLHRHATVTVCHSRTRDLRGICRGADILVVAAGRPFMVQKDWLKEGSVVIDVGMNSIGPDEAPPVIRENPGRAADFEKKGYTLVGDVSPEAAEVASLITPVPGGVGPMTRAMLMENTVKAAEWRKNGFRTEG